jgi:fumarate hydratase class II
VPRRSPPPEAPTAPSRTPSRTTGPRIEHDSLGAVEIPDGALWGAQTQRAVENFPISGTGVPPDLVHALASLKAVAATVNGRLRAIPKDVATAIHDAASEMAFGDYDDQFPVDVFQTGSGTSTNMNANEVLARVASERLGRPVHANDDVNASQSSNDVFPSAVRLAACHVIVRRLIPALDHLHAELRRLAKAHADTVKAGRTHLMDAAPVTLGQEAGGWARQVELGRQRLLDVLPRLGELPLGGTAVGTGLNAPPRFARTVISILAADSGLPLTEAVDHFEAQSTQDALVEASAVARVVALSLHKIAGDLRLMGSGPAAGLAEVQLPALQPGSSIMPGKVNPVIPEAVQQVACQVVGNDAAITFAATLSTFELNTAMPVMARNLLESLRLLAAVAPLLADKCIAGLTADEATMRRYAESSAAVVTALNPVIGYERAAALAKRAMAERRTVTEVVREEGLLDEETLAAVLDPLAMTTGGRRPASRLRPAPGSRRRPADPPAPG